MSSFLFTENFCILGPAVSRKTGTNILLVFFLFTNTGSLNIQGYDFPKV